MTESSRVSRGSSLADLAGGLKAPRAMVMLAALLLAGSMRADMIELSEAGRAALHENHLVAPQAHANGQGWFLEGQIVVLRDETDQPVLHNPWKYFMFRPLHGSFIPTGPDGKAKPDAKEVRLEFSWTHGLTQETDTLDDVRGMISNRDLRYSSGAEALDALLADIDPQGLLRLRKSSPSVADATIVPREGWLSQYLINGPASREERLADVTRIRAVPHDDPLSQNPNDPRQWMMNGNAAMDDLLKAIARCTKWGEAEPGLKSSCFAVAHFICGSIYVVPAEVPVGSRVAATRLQAYAIMARMTLLSEAQVGSLPMLCAPAPGAKPISPKRLAVSPDSAQPVTLLDEAQAALEVLDTCRNLPDRPDARSAVDTLLHCAAGRADFRAAGTREPLQPEFSGVADAIGRRAFEILQHYVTVPPAGTLDTEAAFRAELRPWLTLFDDPATAHAAREALVRAGVGSEAEIPSLLDYLFDQALFTGPEQGNVRENLIFVLKHLPAFIADVNLRQRFQAGVNQRLDQLAVDLEKNQAHSGTKVFLEQYAATP